MDTGLTSDYIKTMRERAEDYLQDIVSGKCKSMEDYRYKTGVVRGLQEAEMLLHETIKHYNKMQDLD